MVPVNDWTITTRGSKQVFVTGLGDKRVFLNWLRPLQLILYYYEKYHSEASRTNDTNVQWVIDQLLEPTVAQSLIR